MLRVRRHVLGSSAPECGVRSRRPEGLRHAAMREKNDECDQMEILAVHWASYFFLNSALSQCSLDRILLIDCIAKQHQVTRRCASTSWQHNCSTSLIVIPMSSKRYGCFPVIKVFSIKLERGKWARMRFYSRVFKALGRTCLYDKFR